MVQFSGSTIVPGLFVAQVEHDTRGEAPLQRNLVNAPGGLALGGEAIVVGGIDVGAGVGEGSDLLQGPALAA